MSIDPSYQISRLVDEVRILNTIIVAVATEKGIKLPPSILGTPYHHSPPVISGAPEGPPPESATEPSQGHHDTAVPEGRRIKKVHSRAEKIYHIRRMLDEQALSTEDWRWLCAELQTRTRSYLQDRLDRLSDVELDDIFVRNYEGVE